MKKLQKNTKVLGYHESTICLFLSGKRPVSWPMAEKLATLFPGKSIREWKSASPAELRRAFEQLKKR